MTQRTSGSDVLLVEDLAQQRLPARTLAAVLRQAGLTAQLAHFGADSDPHSIVSLARCEQPRLIVFSILFARLMAEYLSLATRLRAAGVTSHLTMVGPLPTFAHADLLAACPALDSVVRGGAESSVARLAVSLRDGTDWRVVPGLAYRSPALRVNPPPHPVSNLDDLPFPARDGGLPSTQRVGFATVEGSRGCYHACTFCLPCWFHRTDASAAYRLRSVPHLVDEMEELYRAGVRLFLFDDEQFLPPGKAREGRVAALGDQLARRGLDIAFTIKCRADDVDEDLFRQLKAMGLVRVYVGIESGCQSSLDLLGKGVTVACNARALAALEALDIVADFRSLLFHPWSTLGSIQDELAFLEMVLTHVVTVLTFHEVACYPGTPLAERLQAEGRAGADPWPLAYTIAAPGAELLRRLSRVVFGSRNACHGTHDRFVQAWYDVLLMRRLRPEACWVDNARALREIVVALNRESLAIWREMFSFARDDDLHDADRVNQRASTWAGRVNAFDMMVEKGPSKLPVKQHFDPIVRQVVPSITQDPEL